MFDPEVLQILGLNLMAGRSPNFGENLGNAGLATLQYQRQREEDKLRKEEREFLKQQREMQLEELKRQQRSRQQQEDLYQRFVQPERLPVPYNDALGSEPPQPDIPGAPASFNMEGYMAALPSLGPQGLEQAIRMQQSMGPEFVSVAEGGALVNKRTGQPIFQNAKKEKPKYVKGDIQKYASNGIEYTREFDGENWKTIAKTPQFKPESVGKPVMVEGPNGPMWVTPPSGMEPGNTVPLGIGPKMSESQKKELQGLDAQVSIIDRALAEVKQTPTAFGFRRGMATLGGGISESIAGRFQSPEEQQTRAFIFNVASKAINERAGAAQSAQELARLRSFLPAETDSAEQVQNKLTSFKQYLKEQRNVYSEPVRSGGASGNWGQDDLESALSKYGGRR